MASVPEIDHSDREQHKLTVKDRTDLEILSAAFNVAQRVQVSNFLDDDSARRLRAAAEVQTDYRISTTSDDRRVEINAALAASMSLEDRLRFATEIQRSGTHKFQYMFDVYPVWDAGQAGCLHGIWLELYHLMNSSIMIDIARTITGDTRIDFADIQLTRYRQGHFLNRHNDKVPGTARLYGYVISLNPGWRPEWGGLLLFHDDDEEMIVDAYTPGDNHLDLFRVPMLHSVSQVSLFAPNDRISISGWFRTRSDADV